MTDPDTEPRLSTEEVALMRSIVHWRRAQQIDLVGRCYRRRTDRAAVTWHSPADHPPAVGVSPNYRHLLFRWHQVDTFTRAVDLLAALGYLPGGFSSRHQAETDMAA